MNSAELKRAKRAVRAEVLARRDALDPVERAEMGERIVTRLLDLPELRAARAVMVFWSFGSEVPMDHVDVDLPPQRRRFDLGRGFQLQVSNDTKPTLTGPAAVNVLIA